MKKLFLMLSIATLIIACSKNDDEPTGGGNQNQGTENPSGDLNEVKYNWTGTFNEMIAIINGEIPVKNTSNEYQKWMDDYGKDFNSQTVEQGGLGQKLISGVINFNNTFSEVDKIASEYTGFTIWSGDGSGFDRFFVMLFNWIDIAHLKGYAIEYSEADLDKVEFSDNWLAEFKFTIVDYSGNISAKYPKNFVEWENQHKNNLIEDYESDQMIRKAWKFNLNAFDNKFIIEEIYPYLEFYDTNTGGLEILVDVYHRNEKVLREFIPAMI